MDNRHNLDGILCRYGSGDGSVAMKCEDNARSSRSAPDAPRSLLDPSFDIFDVLRWATHTAYPEARIPETAMRDVTEKFPGRVTYSLSQHFQTIELKYAHQQQPTIQDVERMAAMLQSLASGLLKELGKAELLP